MARLENDGSHTREPPMRVSQIVIGRYPAAVLREWAGRDFEFEILVANFNVARVMMARDTTPPAEMLPPETMISPPAPETSRGSSTTTSK